MDPLFKDYKEQEGRKVTAIIQASTLVATAVLYKLGHDANSAFFILTLVGNAGVYGYWYLADGAVYREAATLYYIEKGGPALQRLKELLPLWSACQQRCQQMAFYSGVFAWISLFAGLTAAFVINIGLLPGLKGAIAVGAAVVILVLLALYDLKRIIAVGRKERSMTLS